MGFVRRLHHTTKNTSHCIVLSFDRILSHFVGFEVIDLNHENILRCRLILFLFWKTERIETIIEQYCCIFGRN